MSRMRRAPNHEVEHADETWLIPYADLMTLLLALFIVLFASSSLDAKKFEQIKASFNSVLSGGTSVLEDTNIVPINVELPNSAMEDQLDQLDQLLKNNQQQEEQNRQIQQETADLKKLKQQLDEYIEQHGLSDQLMTTLNHQQLLIKIHDNALFPSGSAIVKPEAEVLALSISSMVEQYPQYEIKVAGHTDDRPIHTAEFRSNWDLSSMRALNFMIILLQNERLEPHRFSAAGYGEYRPVGPNETEEGRATNRRVEISVIRNIIGPEDSAQ